MPTPPFSLDGHVALVTGSSTGLGKAIAFTLARAGASVAFNYHNSAARAELCMEELRAADFAGEGEMFRADVSDEQAVDRLCSEVEARFGPIDIVVPNATPDQPQMPIEEFTWEHFQTMIDFFIKSPYLLTRRTVAGMKKARWGRIVNVSSEVFQRSVGNFSAYVSAKGGQIGFTRSMATELAPFGITVNSVAPGWIPVERHEGDPQEQKDAYLAAIPMRRWGMPQDVADAVLYYASDEASFVTGQTTCVNGGNTPW